MAGHQTYGSPDNLQCFIEECRRDWLFLKNTGQKHPADFYDYLTMRITMYRAEIKGS